MPSELQEFFKSSPEYKEFVRRSAGSTFKPSGNVQLKIIGKESEIAVEPTEIQEGSGKEIKVVGNGTKPALADKSIASARDISITPSIIYKSIDTDSSNHNPNDSDTEIAISKRVSDSDPVGSKRRRI